MAGVSLLFVALGSSAADLPRKPLIDLQDGQAFKRLVPNSPQVIVSHASDAASVSIATGNESYPGVALHPADGRWDLSGFGDVRATVTNTGAHPITLALRVDNAGRWQDEPSNTESLMLQPGEHGQIQVIFGYSYGRKPAFALKPAAVTQLLLFTAKSDVPESFRIESIEAAGPAGEKPPVNPELLRNAPPEGFLFRPGMAIDLARQVECVGARAAIDPKSHELSLEFPAAVDATEFKVSLKPVAGRWDLRQGTQVHLIVRNDGKQPALLSAHLDSNGGPTDTIASPAAIAPEAKADLVIPFAPAAVWQGIPHSGDRTSSVGSPHTGTHFASDAVSAVVILTPGQPDARHLAIESIKLEAPPARLPDWLGKRPPGDGEWVKTFDDEFDGKTIDETKWNVVGPNYYDKVTRFVKENTTVEDGVARLRLEKRPGEWTDPTQGRKTTDYASGFFDTYGKWTQRYGYFEARMKLPRAPGLWPAFWMMPDRGAKFSGDRGSTADGGMEFDIMEHLTRWGPYRYNIAMHWDGYAKDHKSTGTEGIYVEADKDGYVTAGLLWTPGKAVYYCNGKEVARWEDPRVSSVPSDLMFTLPSGGWDNSPLDNARLPDDLLIDYVRCWQRKDLQEQK